MNEMQIKFTKLLEDDQALLEKIRQQETLDAAYAVAENALPGLTVEEFHDWAKTAFSGGQALTDEQLEGATGGETHLTKDPDNTPPNWIPFL